MTWLVEVILPFYADTYTLYAGLGLEPPCRHSGTSLE